MYFCLYSNTYWMPIQQNLFLRSCVFAGWVRHLAHFTHSFTKGFNLFVDNKKRNLQSGGCVVRSNRVTVVVEVNHREGDTRRHCCDDQRFDHSHRSILHESGMREKVYKIYDLWVIVSNRWNSWKGSVEECRFVQFEFRLNTKLTPPLLLFSVISWRVKYQHLWKQELSGIRRLRINFLSSPASFPCVITLW